MMNRMLDGYDLLIKAQCSESMKSIDSEDVIECLNNERREDVRIGLCHRIAFLIYQDSNFGLFPLDTRSSSILASVGGLCKSMIESGSTFDCETFVGPTKNDSGGTSYSMERLLSATLLSVPKEEIPSLLAFFSSKYPSTASFSQKLLDNDERFLTSLLVLLSLIEHLPSDSIFHPVAVFFEAMNLISYDCEVLIDWLNSELSASSLLLRILKSNCNFPTLWKIYEPKKVDQTTMVKRWKEEGIPVKKPMISLKITEIVGDQEMIKHLNLRELKTKRVEYQKPAALHNFGSFNRWVQMVGELKSRLQRLLAAQLITKKFDVLLKWCDKLCEMNAR